MNGRLSEADKRRIWRHMRVPVFTFAALLGLLACIVLLGALAPSRTASFLEAGLTLCMILTVLIFSMEVREEAPLMRFYAGLGFCWLTILVAITMVDYLTR
jgi:cytochrome c oxidase subunit 4